MKDLENINYKVVSIKEGESNPLDYTNISRMEEGVEYRDVDLVRMAVIENVFQKEINKVLGRNDRASGKEDVLVEIRINRRVLCDRGIGYAKLYSQIGSVLLDLKGKNKEGREVFRISVEYDMSGEMASNIRSLACDSFDKISKIINEKVLPLAVKEIGQNRVIDKL